MNRAISSFLIPLASLTLTVAAVAQSPARPHGTFNWDTFIGSCPVNLSAEPGTATTMVVVAGNGSASQKLNLRLGNSRDTRSVTHAQITVHGLTANGRLTLISGNPNAATIAKQVDLQITVAPGSSTSTGILFKGFSSVSWIGLDSLTYSDGTTWHASPQHGCHIVPNRFMRVPSH